MNKMLPRILALAALLALLAPQVPAAAQKIYWGDSVPAGWNGKWPAKFLTVPEKTNFARTASSTDVLEFIDALRWSSDKVSRHQHVHDDPAPDLPGRRPGQPARDLARRGGQVRQDRRLPPGEYPRLRAGGQRGPADAHARHPLRQAQEPPRQPHHHRLSELQRRRDRHAVLERGDPPYPGLGRQRPEHQPQPRRRPGRDGRDRRALPDGLQPLGPDFDLRRPSHGPRPARLCHRLRHLHGARLPSRSARLRLRQAFPGRPRGDPEELRPRGLHPLRAPTASGRRPSGATRRPCGRTRPSSSPTPTACGTA